jgi:hypothetical protein
VPEPEVVAEVTQDERQPEPEPEPEPERDDVRAAEAEPQLGLF